MKTKRTRHIKNKTQKQKQIDKNKELLLICKNKTSSIESFEKDFEKGLGQNLTKQNNIIHKSIKPTKKSKVNRI